jgi:hypothetical protein
LSIHWETFSWEAFATLTAVIAAGWVGWNQVKIQRRQTIFVEYDLKIQLLDKRPQIYHDRGKQDLASEKLQKSFVEEDKVMKIMLELLDKLIAYTRIDAW